MYINIVLYLGEAWQIAFASEAYSTAYVVATILDKFLQQLTLYRIAEPINADESMIVMAFLERVFNQI